MQFVFPFAKSLPKQKLWRASMGCSDCKQTALIFFAPTGPILKPRPSEQAVRRSITVGRDCGLFQHPLGHHLTLGQSDHLRRASLDLQVFLSLHSCMAGARPPITKHPPHVADIGAIVEHIARTRFFVTFLGIAFRSWRAESCGTPVLLLATATAACQGRPASHSEPASLSPGAKVEAESALLSSCGASSSRDCGSPATRPGAKDAAEAMASRK